MAEETTAELIERLQRELATAREGQAGAILVQDATLRDCKRAVDMVAVKERELAELRADLERERMRLVACDVVAMADTLESAAVARAMTPEYRSAACESVARRVDECIALRRELAELRGRVATLEYALEAQCGYRGRGNAQHNAVCPVHRALLPAPGVAPEVAVPAATSANTHGVAQEPFEEWHRRECPSITYGDSIPCGEPEMRWLVYGVAQKTRFAGKSCREVYAQEHGGQNA